MNESVYLLHVISIYIMIHTDLIHILALVADIVGGKEAEGVWEYGVEENIWT